MAVVGSSSAGGAVAVAAGPCPNDSLRLGPSRFLSNCRAYEMVSPLDKNGGNVDRDALQLDWATSGAATSGDAVAYASTTPFAGNASGSPFSQYRSARKAGGWETRGIDPPLDPDAPINTPSIQLFSADLSKLLMTTNAELTPGADALLGGSRGLYRRDDSGAATSYQLVSTPASPLAPTDVGDPESLAAVRFAAVAATPDLGHVVFNSLARQLTPDGTPNIGQANDNISVYEWVDGQVRFVSVLPDGTPSPNAVAGGRWIGNQSVRYPGDHAISADGQRVFFTAAVNAGPDRPGLYVREGGTTTRAVAVNERTGENPAASGISQFEAAKADDGSLALFTNFFKLTDDAKADPIGGSADLYLWNADGPADHHLTDLTTADPSGGGVLGLAAASDDVSHVYFVASGALAAGASAGTPNLYVWTASDGVRLVATLGGSDESVWSTQRNRDSVSQSAYRDARVSADGTRLLFGSHQQLTSYDNAGHKEAYLFDSDTGDLTCVSCDPLGGPATSDAELFPFGLTATSGGSVNAPYRLPRNLSADGERAFFESAQKLVPGDTNGRIDVYAWESGQLSLISTGQGDVAAQFVDASADGRDVFFTTGERLVGADSDEQVDLYDARIGGGFPVPVGPVPCEADDCQGPLGLPPALSSPASSAFQGPGNVAQPKAKKKKSKKCRKGYVKKRVHGKTKCVKKPKRHVSRRHR